MDKTPLMLLVRGFKWTCWEWYEGGVGLESYRFFIRRRTDRRVCKDSVYNIKNSKNKY